MHDVTGSENPIRILQVFSRMDRGGSETAIMNVYRNIDKNKVQFDFVVHTNEKCSFDDEILALGGIIHRMPRYSLKTHKKYIKIWREFFNNHTEYKVIHGHFFTISSIYFSVARKFNLTCIAHTHSEFRGPVHKRIQMWLMTYMLKYNADYLFACSEAAGKSIYGSNARNRKNFFIINNAIESKKFTFNPQKRMEVRKEFNLDEEFVIGHVGRFNAVKNHKFIIDIFKSINEKNKNARLILVGDGELCGQIKKQVDDLKLTKNVIFTGIRPDVEDLLQAMDVFLFPSIYEGLGIVAVEAQAAGLHTIVSETIPREAHVTDLIEYEYLNSEPSKWADRILKYDNKYERKNMSSIIKQNGYDIIETANWLQDFYLKDYFPFKQ